MCKCQITYRGTPIRHTAVLSGNPTSQNGQIPNKKKRDSDREERKSAQNDIPNKIYLYLKMKQETSPQKQQLNNFSSTRPSIQMLLKDVKQNDICRMQNWHEHRQQNYKRNLHHTMRNPKLKWQDQIITCQCNHEHKLLKFNQKTDQQTGLKNRTHLCCLQETLPTNKNTWKLKVKGKQKIFQVNEKEKGAGETIFIS